MAAVLAALGWHGWYGPDIWSHLFLGRGVWESGSASPPDQLILEQPAYWNVYWLFQLAVWGLYRLAGVAGVTSFFSALWFGIFLLWAKSARALEAPGLGPPLALAGVLICQVRFEERPEVLSFLFLALEAWLLARYEPERSETPAPLSRGSILTLGALQVIWTNVHGYFVLGPAVALLRLCAFAVSAGPRARASRRVWASLGLAVLVPLALTLASPFGIRSWLGVWDLGGSLRAFRFAIDELGPPIGGYPDLWTVRLFWAYGAVTLIAAVRLLWRRASLFAALLALAGLALAASSLRNVPMAVVLAGPLWGATLAARRAPHERSRGSAGARRPRSDSGRDDAASSAGGAEFAVEPAPRRGERANPRALETVSSVAVLLASLLLVAWIVEGGFHRSLGSAARFGLDPRPHVYPARFARYLRETGFRGRIFNHPGDGGYLQFHVPDAVLYGDARFTEPAPVREYFDALAHLPAFRALDARHRFDAVLVHLPGGQFSLFGLLESPDWRLAYADPHRALLASARTAAGGAAPSWPPRFYDGEDLAYRPNGLSAIRWVDALARLGWRDLLRTALEQLAAAPRVPAPAIEVALAHGLRAEDPEIVRMAAALHPKAIAIDAAEAEALERLILEAGRRAGPDAP